MLLRKRVWDIMREDFAFVREDASLSEAIGALRAIRVQAGGHQLRPGLRQEREIPGHPVHVEPDPGHGPLPAEGLGPGRQRGGIGTAPFPRLCRSCAQVRISDCLQHDIPVLKPNDPLARVLEVFLDYRRGRAVVEEGGKIIGVVCMADLFKEISDSLIP